MELQAIVNECGWLHENWSHFLKSFRGELLGGVLRRHHRDCSDLVARWNDITVHAIAEIGKYGVTDCF